MRLTTWAMNNHQGNIDVGDFVLLCPGVKSIDSASLVTIGESSMLWKVGLTLPMLIGMTFMTALRPLAAPHPLLLAATYGSATVPPSARGFPSATTPSSAQALLSLKTSQAMLSLQAIQLRLSEP
ncbi:MAG: hypothetical protein CM15mP120_21160 [Pseudomonadota bacterium]|nr:MAG: hypothetical protein CM15mP120_21160 [Pseudomonadota bacterium]